MGERYLALSSGLGGSHSLIDRPGDCLMTAKGLSLTLAALIGATTLPCGAAAEPAKARKPNVIVILADDKDYDFVRLPQIEPINEPRA